MGSDQVTRSYTRPYSTIQNIGSALNSFAPCLSLLSPFLLELQVASDHVTVSVVLSFPICHMVGVIQCVALPDWLSSLVISIKGSSISFQNASLLTAGLHLPIWVFHGLPTHTKDI